MEAEQSLLEYLMQQNPDVDASKGGKGKNTTCYKDAWKEPVRILDWTDFRPESLLMSFDGRLNEILKMNFVGLTPHHIPAFPFREVYDEDSLETLLILWTQQIVSNALVVAQDQLPTLCSSGRIYMARGGQARFLTAFPKNRKRRNSYPDWAAVRHTTSTVPRDTKAMNILPGDTKISSKWMSKDVVFGDRDAYNSNPDSARPVLQVYNYCLKANVRYGYIITDQELVVLRVRTVEISGGHGHQVTGDSQESQELYASESQKKARQASEVELKSIAWNGYDPTAEGLRDTLTVNLALWWLHLMAAARSSIDSQYPSLCDEVLPLNPTDSFGFSDKIASINLEQSTSFASEASEAGQNGKKRKRLDPKIKRSNLKRRNMK